MHTVIVGAGQGGTSVAETLRDRGFDGTITLLDASSELPYRRPPLSKGFLSGVVDHVGLRFRPASFYDQLDIDLLLGESATKLDRARRQLTLASGARLDYDQLVIATGSRPRPWMGDGAGLDGAFCLSTVEDAENIRTAMQDGDAIVVVGGGFIGLEVASTAAKAGLDVTVLEATDRLMARALSPVSSEILARRHHEHGVTIRARVCVDAIVGSAGRVTGVRLDTGEVIPCGMVLVGMGSTAATGPISAEQQDAPTGAIRVDEHLRTDDPSVWAIGDTAAFLRDGRRIRLESVQNATDQARSVARALTGEVSPYTSVPWFWTEQAGTKVQMAGLIAGADRHVVRGDPSSASFTVFAFRGDDLLGAESFAMPAEHIAVRSLLTHGLPLSPNEARDPSFPLTSYARSTPLATA